MSHRPDLGTVIRAAFAGPSGSRRANRLSAALEPWLPSGESQLLAAIMLRPARDPLEVTLADAKGLIDFLAEQEDVEPLLGSGTAPMVDDDYEAPALGLLSRLFEIDSTNDATLLLRDRGLPELVRLFDAALALPEPMPEPLVPVARAFALYAHAPGVSRIATAFRELPDDAWGEVFGLFADENHPHGVELVEHLRDPLPDHFATIFLLELSNVLAQQERLTEHPFNTPEGWKLLSAWLQDKDSDVRAEAKWAAVHCRGAAE